MPWRDTGDKPEASYLFTPSDSFGFVFAVPYSPAEVISLLEASDSANGCTLKGVFTIVYCITCAIYIIADFLK